jgi:hypothetical protein
LTIFAIPKVWSNDSHTHYDPVRTQAYIDAIYPKEVSAAIGVRITKCFVDEKGRNWINDKIAL